MTKIRTKMAGRSFGDMVVYYTIRNIVTAFCVVWCRMRVEGKENIPKEGIFILAPTHRSILDTPISSGVTRRRMRFMGADKWWKNKWFGKVLTACGGFPVTRGSADREALKRCIAVLEDGEPLVLFPEGERKSGPVVQPLFDGAAYIAAKSGAPIIPVAIGGSERAMPKGAKFIYPKKVHVIVGAPMPAPTGGTMKEQREAVRVATLALHTTMQAMLDEAQRKAGA